MFWSVRSFLLVFSLFIAGMISACAPVDLTVDGNDSDYKVTNVTPAVISKLKNDQRELYHLTDNSVRTTDAPYSYHLGPGDILLAKLYIPSVDGFDESNNNRYNVSDNWQEYNEVIVKDDGMVSFPYVGDLLFADKTLSEAKQMLDMALKKYFKNAQAVLEVKDFKSRKVQLTGELKTPGEQYLRFVPLHVLEAITAAGGLTNTADLSNATIIHKDGSVDKVNLFALINTNDTSQNRILLDGDTLYIPVNYGNKVFVMGEVNKPTLEYIEAGRLTVMEAMNTAIGLNATTASYSRIYIIRGAINDDMFDKHDVARDAKLHPADVLLDDPNQPERSTLSTSIYQLDGSTGSGLAMAAQFPLQPNDVVYVSSTPITDWNRFITQLLPFNALDATSIAHGWGN